MRRNRQRGVAFLEFAFIMLVLIPLMLGTTAIGLNMLTTLSTVQLARDAGHMYAKGTDFSQPGNKTILLALGSSLGLTSNTTTSKALIVLSAVTYIDKAMCASAGKVDANGNPLGCTNFGNWVFTQRISIGNSNMRTSNFGSPLTSGPNGAIVNSTTGKISLMDQVTKSGAVASFSGINPYSNVNGVVSGLPSGQVIYIAEAASTGISMPFATGEVMYSFGMF
jgi:Flp pilus assembly protein TadG